MSDGVRDPFGSGGPPAVKFENVGDAVEGVILGYEVQEDRDPDTGEVKTFQDGKPRPVVVVTLELANGEKVRDFVKGRSVSQFRQEVHAAEGPGETPKNGAKYRRELTGFGEKKSKTRNPEKLFQVDYWAAEGSDASGDDEDDLF